MTPRLTRRGQSGAGDPSSIVGNSSVWKISNVNWDFLLARAAERSLRSMPVRDRRRVNAALNDMKADPFAGDVTALKGEYRGLFRRRVGSWRVIFELDAARRLVRVHDILRRSSTTY
ncbi:MAG TPA: hypothetical protein VMF86_10740 [Stellaceae bacterium]|nr:hypothetical protein [Stellaceae bacterium]